MAKGSTVTLSIASAATSTTTSTAATTTAATTTESTTTEPATTTAATTTAPTTTAAPPQPTTATMPDVTGQTEAAAATAMNRAGILAEHRLRAGLGPARNGAPAGKAGRHDRALPLARADQRLEGAERSNGPHGPERCRTDAETGSLDDERGAAAADLRQVPGHLRFQTGKVVQQSPLWAAARRRRTHRCSSTSARARSSRTSSRTWLGGSRAGLAFTSRESRAARSGRATASRCRPSPRRGRQRPAPARRRRGSASSPRRSHARAQTDCRT